MSRFPAAVAALAFFMSLAARAQTTYNVPTTQYPTIQSAINAAKDGDTVSVAPGTYTENIDFESKALQVIGSAGAATTIIDGGGKGPVVTMVGPFANVFLLPALTGFTIQNGGLPQTTGGPQGAIYIYNAAPVVTSNTVTKAFCQGIMAANSAANISGNHITQTLAPSGCPAGEGKGSAIYVSGGLTGGSGAINTNILEQNTASVAASSDKGGGGAINIANAGTIYIGTNTIRKNSTTGYGGGIYTANSPNLYIFGNLIYGNTGISGGMDIVIPGATTGAVAGLISNNTIAENTGSGNGGSDIYLGGNLAQYVVINNIIVGYASGQTAFNCGTLYASQTLTPLVFDHNDIYSVAGSSNTPIGGACTSPAGSFGNISVDPEFTLATAAALTAGTSDFHLATGSPAIDTGNNDVFAISPPFGEPYFDIDLSQRPGDATGLGYRVIDMGAYENTGMIVEPKGSALALTPSTYSPTTGSTVTLTAAVSLSATPGGSITFYEDGTSIGTMALSSTLQASFTTAALTAGTHSFYAIYPGQGTSSAATSVKLYLLVAAPVTAVTNTSLTSSKNPSNSGDAVTLTATVVAASGSAIPTGTVYFSDGAVSLGNATLDATGKASLTITTLAMGMRSLTAAFVPGTGFKGGTASYTQTVNGAASTASLTVAPSTANVGAPFTFTAIIAASSSTATIVPTGSVVFTEGGNILGSASVSGNGMAALMLTTLSGGTHNVTCIYQGDTTYGPANCTNTVSVTINAVASALKLSVSPNPSPALTPVTLSALLTSGSPATPIASTIVFAVDGVATSSAATNASGIASITVRLPAGQHNITASFASTSSYTASSDQQTLSVTQNPTTSTLIAAPSSVYQGQPVTFAASILATIGDATPVGTVTLFEATRLIATLPTSAVAFGRSLSNVSFAVTNLTVGTHTVYAVYTPDGNSTGSTSNNVSITVLPQTFTLTLGSPSITIQTAHKGSLNLRLDSIGFTGPVTLACVPPLAPIVTCEFGAQPYLSLNGSATTILTLDTDALLNYHGTLKPAPTPGSRLGWISLATLFPLTLFSLRRKRHARVVFALSILCALSSTLCLTGCSGKIPDHTPPGTYDVTLTATGTGAGSTTPVTQTQHLTLVVTP